MKNFNPVRWQNFAINKEVKRIKKENSRTFWNKVQFMTSIIVVCLSMLLDSNTIENKNARIYIAIGMISVLLLVFIAPWLYKLYKTRRIATLNYKDSDLIRLFDEEIIYNVIIAYEFYKEKKNPEVIIDNDLVEFYNIEQSYYYSKAIEDLKKLDNRKEILKDFIKEERIQNVLNLLKLLKKDDQMKVSENINKYAVYLIGDKDI